MRLVIPVAILGAGWGALKFIPGRWDVACRLTVGFALLVFLAGVAGGRWRNCAVAVASLLLCLAAAETYAIAISRNVIETAAPGYSVFRPILGWGPEHAGVFHARKADGATGRVIYDVDYTIDEHRDRRVIAAADGPTIAFFGDSMTFGQGIPDADTLPQAVADATGRRFRVLNLAFPGYGPQQFLRPLEVDLFRDRLTEPRLFVFLTAPWHAERAACMRSFTRRAPRYVMADGGPVYQGACEDHWPARLRYRLTEAAMYRVFFEPAFGGAGPAEIDLYVAMLIRAGRLAREKYGVSTVILYLSDDPYLRRAGVTDEQIVQRLRDGGLTVVDAAIDPAAFPGQVLSIPEDGHPTGVANRARAEILVKALGDLIAFRR